DRRDDYPRQNQPGFSSADCVKNLEVSELGSLLASVSERFSRYLCASCMTKFATASPSRRSFPLVAAFSLPSASESCAIVLSSLLIRRAPARKAARSLGTSLGARKIVRTANSLL